LYGGEKKVRKMFGWSSINESMRQRNNPLLVRLHSQRATVVKVCSLNFQSRQAKSFKRKQKEITSRSTFFPKHIFFVCLFVCFFKMSGTRNKDTEENKNPRNFFWKKAVRISSPKSRSITKRTWKDTEKIQFLPPRWRPMPKEGVVEKKKNARGAVKRMQGKIETQIDGSCSNRVVRREKKESRKKDDQRRLSSASEAP